MKKIISETLLIIFIIILLISYWHYLYLPEFKVNQFFQSIIVKKQNLPLEKMFFKNTHDFIVPEGTQQFITTGPYQTLANGNYTVKYEITSICNNQPLGYIDVAKDKGGSILVSEEVNSETVKQNKIISLPFDASTGSNYEFRFYSYGNCQFQINKAWLERNRLYDNRH